MCIPKGEENIVTHLFTQSSGCEVPVNSQLQSERALIPVSPLAVQLLRTQVRQAGAALKALRSGKACCGRQGQSVISCQLLISRLVHKIQIRARELKEALKKKAHFRNHKIVQCRKEALLS